MVDQGDINYISDEARLSARVTPTRVSSNRMTGGWTLCWTRVPLGGSLRCTSSVPSPMDAVDKDPHAIIDAMNTE